MLVLFYSNLFNFELETLLKYFIKMAVKTLLIIDQYLPNQLASVSKYHMLIICHNMADTDDKYEVLNVS